jgi:hypothetical protein
MFVVQTKNTLKEEFREGIEITNKALIVEKLYSETFVSKKIFLEAFNQLKKFPILFSMKTVEGYTVTEYRGFSDKYEATNFLNFLIALRETNIRMADRSHQPSEEDTMLIFTAYENEDFIKLTENYEPLPLNIDNIIFKVQEN